jgi:hypothetical protein
MKRLALLVVALGALAVGVPAAETAPTSDTGCTAEHLSGAACQGPDVRPAPSSCEIATWVGDASCALTVADGAADTTIGFLKVYATLQADNNWQTEFHMVIRDLGTGEFLFSRDGGTTTPLAEAHEPPEQTQLWSAPLAVPGGSEVVCEITGSHTPVGAAFSAQAVLEGFGAFNNRFQCEVR